LLDSIVESEKFALVMKKNIQDMIIFLFEEEQNFGILCRIEDAVFDPELPQDIHENFSDLTLFMLAGYTFESARIDAGILIFEAGFGNDNFGSVVTISLLSIFQIIIDDRPVLINLASYQTKETHIKEVTKHDENGVKNSMSSFLSNPENSKFLK
jgi:hypothetical protein